MRVALAVAVAVAVAIAVPDRAEACTAHRPARTGTRNGATLPTNGVLYWALLGGAELGSPQGLVVSRSTVVQIVGMHADAAIRRIEYTAMPGPLRVNAASPYQQFMRIDFEYVVEPTWEISAPPRAISIRRALSEEARTAGVFIELDQPVAAIKAIWRTASGERAEQLFLPQTDRERAELWLGQTSCGESNFDGKLLRAGVAIELVAIRNDGSAASVLGLPPVLDLDELPDFNTVEPVPDGEPTTWLLALIAIPLVVVLITLAWASARPARPARSRARG